jgi:hypothetical protein
MDEGLKQDAGLENGTTKGFKMGEARTFDNPLARAA